MKKHSGVLLVILLVIIIIGGCALKDRLLKKETPKQITNSLQLFLKFDASSIEDLSDYHNLISKQGSFNFTEDYNRFDGKTTFIEIGKDFNKNQALSIGFWIKPVKRQSGFIMANGPVKNITKPVIKIITVIHRKGIRVLTHCWIIQMFRHIF